MVCRRNEVGLLLPLFREGQTTGCLQPATLILPRFSHILKQKRSPDYLIRASLSQISGSSDQSTYFDLHLHAHSPAQPRRLFVQLDGDCVHHVATDRVRLRRDVYHLTPNLHAQRFHVHGRLLSH